LGVYCCKILRVENLVKISLLPRLNLVRVNKLLSKLEEEQFLELQA
jgi:hypothetical protein